jgi:hypothetical protein
MRVEARDASGGYIAIASLPPSAPTHAQSTKTSSPCRAGLLASDADTSFLFCTRHKGSQPKPLPLKGNQGLYLGKTIESWPSSLAQATSLPHPRQARPRLGRHDQLVRPLPTNFERERWRERRGGSGGGKEAPADDTSGRWGWSDGAAAAGARTAPWWLPRRLGGAEERWGTGGFDGLGVQRRGRPVGCRAPETSMPPSPRASTPRGSGATRRSRACAGGRLWRRGGRG